jgi:hypothetical protein
MAKIYCMTINRVHSGNVNVDNEEAWLELEIDEITRVRLLFKESLLTSLRHAVQRLLGRFSEVRLEQGKPSLQVAYKTRIKRMEFGHDDVRRVALIRTWYESGEYQDMVLGEDNMHEIINYFQATLIRFGKDKTLKN